MEKKTKEEILNDINKTIKGLEENNRKSDQSYRETSKFVSQKKKEIQEIEQKIKEMDKKARLSCRCSRYLRWWICCLSALQR